MTNVPITDQKLVVAGRVIEVSTFGVPFVYGTPRPPNMNPRSPNARRTLTEAPASRSSVWRAKTRLRLLIFANSWTWPRPDGHPIRPLFVTLTFAENITDDSTATAHFTHLIEKLNDRWRGYLDGGLKYVAVPERQERGAVHFHLLTFNLPDVTAAREEIVTAWGHHGRADVRPINKVEKKNLAQQLSGYLSKGLADGHKFNGKRYFPSRGLKQPKTINDPCAVRAIIDGLPVGSHTWTGEPKPHERLGTCVSSRYVIPEGFDIDALVTSAVGKPRAENQKDA